jgi:hypothetical protein
LAVRRGSLTITAEREGFAKLVRSGVQLTAADTLTVNLQLMVGDVKQSVEVTSAAPLLQSQSAAVSQLVDNRQVLELPLSGRQFTSLIALAPGAYVGSAGNLGSAVYALRGNSNYSVNGSQADNNSYLIDGLVNAGLWINNMVIVPTPDSIQEVRAMTSNYSAEYGSAAGMVTIVQTKSGSKELHGSGYEFLQNAQMNANNFLSNLNKFARGAAAERVWRDPGRPDQEGQDFPVRRLPGPAHRYSDHHLHRADSDAGGDADDRDRQFRGLHHRQRNASNDL